MTPHEKDKNRDSRNAGLKELRKVYGPAEAEIIKGFLESQGITCILQGRMVQSVMPFTTNGLAEIRILVSDKDFEAAAGLLETVKNFQENGEEF